MRLNEETLYFVFIQIHVTQARRGSSLMFEAVKQQDLTLSIVLAHCFSVTTLKYLALDKL